jgi:hypothetical protein
MVRAQIILSFGDRESTQQQRKQATQRKKNYRAKRAGHRIFHG